MLHAFLGLRQRKRRSNARRQLRPRCILRGMQEMEQGDVLVGTREADGPVQDQPRAQEMDGVKIAAEIKAELLAEVARAQRVGYVPGLAVVLVGDHAASEIYVRNKVRTCGELGLYSEMHTPPASVTTEDLLDLVERLNARPEIDGILIQLPLPAHVDTARLLEAVDPAKDVDGFHPLNAGRLMTGVPLDRVLAPCTPAGLMEILKRSAIPVRGRRAVVMGKSNIVGKPAAVMLMNAGATVTVVHKGSHDVPSITRTAEILVVAVGSPGLVTPDMVRPGVVLLDVGINRVADERTFARLFPADAPDAATRREIFARRGSVLTGDVAPATLPLSSFYTPVPGGVGALTIAMLMSNTVKAAHLRRGL